MNNKIPKEKVKDYLDEIIEEIDAVSYDTVDEDTQERLNILCSRIDGTKRGIDMMNQDEQENNQDERPTDYYPNGTIET